ncbi:hypothetical protein COLO4_29371 [Corchorus olitorius]|uniref:Uncharacterized protein n=1 Tax=Corchorus olitorius TaxID=93759 RepID=A0A1R3HES4_9ROSI|nr:hypothetical protein COLO4_29371 [Corchorus olitorius]
MQRLGKACDDESSPSVPSFFMFETQFSECKKGNLSIVVNEQASLPQPYSCKLKNDVIVRSYEQASLPQPYSCKLKNDVIVRSFAD